MNGTIEFESTNQLAEFLKEFVGCTAIFTVRRNANGYWVLTFTGGF